MIITSLKNKQVMEACALKEKKYRDALGKFLIEGEHLLEMAENVEVIFTTHLDFQSPIPTFYVSSEVMAKLSFTKAPQGIVAVVKKKVMSIDYNQKYYLLCDNVSDPGNLGTIIRTALAFQLDGVILSENSVDIYNDKVIRGSQGAIFKVPVVYENLSFVIKKLKEHHVCVYASTLQKNSIDLQEVDKVEKFALIVGNEGAGISKEIIDSSDKCIKIYHSSAIDSLNVSVATSIMLYHFMHHL